MDPSFHQEITSSLVVGVLVSETVEMLKRARWCPLDYDTEKLNRAVGAFLAFLSGLGLSVQFDAAAGRLVIDGLFVGAITHGLAQWAWQQAYWRMAVRHTAPIADANPILDPLTGKPYR